MPAQQIDVGALVHAGQSPHVEAAPAVASASYPATGTIENGSQFTLVFPEVGVVVDPIDTANFSVADADQLRRLITDAAYYAQIHTIESGLVVTIDEPIV